MKLEREWPQGKFRYTTHTHTLLHIYFVFEIMLMLLLLDILAKRRQCPKCLCPSPDASAMYPPTPSAINTKLNN